jgi:hypothetical protein
VRSWAIACLGSLTACGFDLRPADDPGDAGADAAEGCFGAFVSVCLATQPTAALVFDTNTVIDTETSTLCTATTGTSGDRCVIAATEISISAGVTVRGTGTHPLIFVATTGSLTIGGTIDVASRRGAAAGAGANPATCGTGTTATGSGLSYGGGHGGSFISGGGNGGMGNPVGTGGLPGPTTPLTALRGGCRGGAGGGVTPAAPGAGGGAVDLIAPAIVINGAIHASGAGGAGTGVEGAGGAGGGSGGTIVFDAASVTIGDAGLLLAQGGGGGEGSGGNVSRPGADPITPGVAAVGGSGGSDGGDGGAGAASIGAGPGSPPTAANSGGGGGGGGIGVIKSTVTPTTSSIAIAPPIS